MATPAAASSETTPSVTPAPSPSPSPPVFTESGKQQAQIAAGQARFTRAFAALALVFPVLRTNAPGPHTVGPYVATLQGDTLTVSDSSGNVYGTLFVRGRQTLGNGSTTITAALGDTSAQQGFFGCTASVVYTIDTGGRLVGLMFTGLQPALTASDYSSGLMPVAVDGTLALDGEGRLAGTLTPSTPPGKVARLFGGDLQESVTPSIALDGDTLTAVDDTFSGTTPIGSTLGGAFSTIGANVDGSGETTVTDGGGNIGAIGSSFASNGVFQSTSPVQPSGSGGSGVLGGLLGLAQIDVNRPALLGQQVLPLPDGARLFVKPANAHVAIGSARTFSLEAVGPSGTVPFTTTQGVWGAQSTDGSEADADPASPGRFIGVHAGTSTITFTDLGTKASATGKLVISGASPTPTPTAVSDLALVTDFSANTLSILTIDPLTGRMQAISSIPTGTGPTVVRVNPLPGPSGERFVYVANRFSDNISVYKLFPSNPAMQEVSGSPFSSQGTQPVDLAITRSNSLFVLNSGSANVHVLVSDPSSGALSDTGIDAPTP